MNKVLIIVGDASETVDTLYPYYRLQEDDFEPVVADSRNSVWEKEIKSFENLDFCF